MEGTTKESLMNMLGANRFNIYSRGINEVFGELKAFAKSHPDVVLDPDIALYSYIPTYFHVAPNAKRIAERLEEGLRIIDENGTYEKLFLEQNQQAITQAQLEKRKILIVNDNNAINELWLNDLNYLYTTPAMR